MTPDQDPGTPAQVLAEDAPDVPDAPDARPVRVMRPRPLMVRLFTEYNPFYLLSAACMLASCLALTNTTTWDPIPRNRLLTLIVTINVYEAALLGIALFLVRRRGLQRDGRMLLVLQAFFLADFAFLNSEIATAEPAIGAAVNLALFLLAVCKLWAVAYVLRPRLTPAQWGFVALQLFALYATPCVLKALDGAGDHIPARHLRLYVAWWVLALLPAVYEVIARWDPRRTDAPRAITAADEARPGNAAPVRVYLALPYVSLMTHLGILHYVYDVPFYGADAAPVLLGLTLVVNRFAPSSMFPRSDLLVLRLLMPLGAVVASSFGAFAIPWPLGDLAPLYPKHLTIVAAFLVYVYCFLWHVRWIALGAGLAAAAAWTFQESLTRAAVRAFQSVAGILDRLIPRTAAHWGAIGVAASFVFLGIGFWVSLRRRPGPIAGPDDDPPIPPAPGQPDPLRSDGGGTALPPPLPRPT